MKWLIFRRGLRIGGLLFCLVGLIAVRAQGEEQSDRHLRKLERYQQGWNRLVPRYAKIQYAGSMGLVSTGIGWDYGRRKQWETDFFLGYLPRFDGDKRHVTMTLKENYIPWRLNIGQSRWRVEPFTASLYINKIFGDEFWTRDPERYPSKSYYGVATNLRFDIAFGQGISMKIKPVGLSQRIKLFYEFATNDLYLISYLTNRYLRVSDIFNLSLGIKFQFL